MGIGISTIILKQLKMPGQQLATHGGINPARLKFDFRRTDIKEAEGFNATTFIRDVISHVTSPTDTARKVADAQRLLLGLAFAKPDEAASVAEQIGQDHIALGVYTHFKAAAEMMPGFNLLGRLNRVNVDIEDANAFSKLKPVLVAHNTDDVALILRSGKQLSLDKEAAFSTSRLGILFQNANIFGLSFTDRYTGIWITADLDPKKVEKSQPDKNVLANVTPED